ncbi:MAG: hypothetical protein ACKPE3_14140 [Sphaerospermopsis kisseleviana]
MTNIASTKSNFNLNSVSEVALSKICLAADAAWASGVTINLNNAKLAVKFSWSNKSSKSEVLNVKKSVIKIAQNILKFEQAISKY